MPSCRPPRRVAILGAGLAGLSVALELLARDGRPEIVLVDRRETFPRDRTWCAWETGAWPIAGVARTRWHAWRVRADDRVAVHARSPIPYACWSSDDVHRHALSRLQAAGGVSLRLGQRVLDVDARAGTVRTDAGGLEADLVIDALALSSPLLRRHDRGRGLDGRPAVAQAFLGLEVETERPVFDPGIVDLMDFDALPRTPGFARFLYLLPFSPTRALLEDTTFGPGDLAAQERRDALAAWLERQGAGSWRVVHEERGRLPMSTVPFPLRHGRRVWTAGTGAGALRPSSGYALARIQRHAAALAQAVVAGRPAPPGLGSSRRAPLDAVLLRALRDAPDAAGGWFRGLVEHSDPGSFARFMSDASSPLDEARMALAAPVVPMSRAAVAELRHTTRRFIDPTAG
ncbi:lycopene cyclase family protein [Paraconexibacter sp.]|uniref:lycopene cyclase family protein n=1 Tax=Paraconexibacter sp. TaxID=2949640 RepID=UPI003562C2A7